MGRKNHGFVTANGRGIICGDYKRHERMKRKRKYNYEQDIETRQDELTHH